MVKNILRTNKVIILFFFSILLVALVHTIALAGGTTWVFEVQEFREITPTEHVVVLKPLESGTAFPLNCPTLTVHVHYSSWRWLFVSDKSISKKKHEKALSVLKESHTARTPIHFGSMGEGFGFQKERSQCEVFSRALSVLEVEGTQQVYSYYKWP